MGAVQSLPIAVRVNETSGDLFLTEPLDREHRDRYEFSVVAVDSLNQSLNDTAKVVRTPPTTGLRFPIIFCAVFNRDKTNTCILIVVYTE